jgi:hypothetical protein
MLTMLIAILMIPAGFMLVRMMDAKRLSAPAHAPAPAPVNTGNLSVPTHEPAPSSENSSVPVIHNSPDTECEDHKQCTDDEFEDLTDSLGRQWALMPEELRSKCTANATYPPLEHCILSESVSWLAKHPSEAAPWINPKNFDTGIMALCEKDPKSLPLCSKP